MSHIRVQITTTWALTIILTTLLAGIWYIFQPTFTYTTILMDTAMQNMDVNSTSSDRVVTLLKLGINVVIPIMIIGLWGWALVRSQKIEWRGYDIE